MLLKLIQLCELMGCRRWPGTIIPGVSDYAWAFWDFMPTVAELSGGTAPADTDGVSIVPTLYGKSQDPKSYLYWTWAGTGMASLDLQADWVLEQLASGLLGYRNVVSGEVASQHPSLGEGNARPTKGKGSPGYGVRIGDWKGVVAHCAATADGIPSAGKALPSTTFLIMLRWFLIQIA